MDGVAYPLGNVGVLSDLDNKFGYPVWALHYGGVQAGRPPKPEGMHFGANVSVPSPYYGTAAWIQIVESAAALKLNGNVVVSNYSCQGFDAVGPSGVHYPYKYGTSTDDSPGFRLFSNTGDYYGVTGESFTMWLMFRQTDSAGNPSPDSIEIPIAKISWNWAGHAAWNHDTNSIVWSGSGSASPGPAAVAITPTSDFPDWSASTANAGDCPAWTNGP